MSADDQAIINGLKDAVQRIRLTDMSNAIDALDDKILAVTDVAGMNITAVPAYIEHLEGLLSYIGLDEWAKGNPSWGEICEVRDAIERARVLPR